MPRQLGDWESLVNSMLGRGVSTPLAGGEEFPRLMDGPTNAPVELSDQPFRFSGFFVLLIQLICSSTERFSRDRKV